MAKVTNTDIIILGFTKEMFRQATDDSFEEFIDDVITEQSAILSGRIGSTIYASTTSPAKDYVKRAEKCLVTAEMLQCRINIIVGNVTGAGQEFDTLNEAKQKAAYIDEADKLVIEKLSDGDFASGVLETDHFDSVSEL